MSKFGIGALILFILFFILLFVAITFPGALNHPLPADAEQQNAAARSNT